jgi:exosortase
LSTASAPSAEIRAVDRSMKASWEWFVLLAAMLFLYAKTLGGLFYDWWENPDYSHGLLLPFALAYIAYQKREALQKIPVRPHWLGAVLVFGALGINLVGFLGAEFFLQRFSFLLFVAGSILFLFGFRHLAQAGFGLLLIALAIPLPAIIFNVVSLPLQLIASEWAESFLRVCSIPVFREGNILMLSSQTLNVTEACSGIRSLMSLITLGVMLAYFLPFRWWIRGLFVATTIPIALVANAFRVAGTGILGKFFGDAAAQGFFHTFSGWIVFVSAFAVLFTEVMLLMKWRRKHYGETNE